MKSWALVIAAALATVGAAIAGATAIYSLSIFDALVSVLYIIFIGGLLTYAQLIHNATFNKLAMMWFAVCFALVLVTHITQIDPVNTLLVDRMGSLTGQSWFNALTSALYLIFSFAMLPLYPILGYFQTSETMQWIAVEAIYVAATAACLVLKGALPQYEGVGRLLDSDESQDNPELTPEQ